MKSRRPRFAGRKFELPDTGVNLQSQIPGDLPFEQRLEEGKKYHVGTKSGQRVPVCPCHVDEITSVSASSLECEKSQWCENFDFEILEIRRRNGRGVPWYRVKVADGQEGWKNSIALINVAELKPL